MYARFSESARAVMQVANKEAVRVGHQYIGTDDILVGLAAGEATLASQAIASHADLETIRQKLAEMSKIEDGKTSRSQKIVEHAMEEAQRLFHLEVGPEHLLLGLLRDDSSDAIRALRELGIDLEKLKSEVLNQLPPGSPKQIHQLKDIQERFSDHPDVKHANSETERLQRELENAVAAGRFDLAASFRDQRRVAEQELLELYRKLANP